MDGAAYGHFGSAPYFVIHDPETQKTEVMENANAHHAHGGCQPLRAIEGHDVDAIVVGGIGARAIARLNISGIKVYRAVEGTVAENIEKLASGVLEEITPEGGCAGHHGQDHDCG
ncbi:NifB/NifX family molybdenum-iron cluster-binding protein [Candidatus Bipolaricaulota bacterium]